MTFFEYFPSYLAGELLKKMPNEPNKFNSCRTESFYVKTFSTRTNEFQLSNLSEETKIFFSDTNKVAGINERIVSIFRC